VKLDALHADAIPDEAEDEIRTDLVDLQAGRKSD
jgi:hypothetical protein